MKILFSRIIFPVLLLLLITQSGFALDFTELENKANQGDAEAMYEVGEMYEKGVGTIQNYVEAHKWFNIAASRGQVKALNARNALAEKMTAEQLAEAQKLAIQWKLSIDKGPKAETETKDKKQLLLRELFKAIHDSDGDKAKELLDSGADPNAEIFTGVPILMVAVRENRKQMVETLVNAGADVNVTIKNGMTLLMLSIKEGHGDIAKYLIEQGANLDSESDSGSTALSLAKSKGFDTIVELIKNAGERDDQEQKDQITGNIFNAVEQGDVDMLKKLLARGADPNKRDMNGRFPLIFAASGGQKEIVETLIKAGADVNIKAADGSTALMAAALQAHNSIVKFLLGKGADISVKNSDGETALIIARQKGHDETAGLLAINLRSSYRDLGYGQVKTALKKYNFFDQHRNETGDFINDYELKVVRGDEFVKDHATGLLWHQSGSEKNMNWKDAKKWIQDLNRKGYAGYQDWRLPTIEEAASLLESSENDDYLYIDPIFNSTQRLIWTGDSFGSRGAWDVNFVTGGVIWRYTVLNLYVRPVRSAR